MKIGVFDSGLGGLTMLKAFARKLPQYNYIYLGDNARTPYGNKSQDVIYEYTREAVDFLFQRGCVLIILACNTASTKALRKIQHEFLPARYPDRRVLGVVIPLAEAGVEATRYGRIGVIGTQATIESRVYEQELEKLSSRLKVFGQACPLLVPLVEEGWVGKPETNMILKKYLRRLKRKKIDTLILGCTHYPFLHKDIERIMGRNCRVVDGPGAVSHKLKDYLRRHPEIEQRTSRSRTVTFCTTDDPARFKVLGQGFLGRNMAEVERVILDR
ncbi:MAG: glutamate racemase [Deltaproteobacteria bacterium]|nr:glutamate racemase [Deltaproteobacteria bacterium]MBW2110404.1 glutamate racemase [Deltaproteobacteria bacterium]